MQCLVGHLEVLFKPTHPRRLSSPAPLQGLGLKERTLITEICSCLLETLRSGSDRSERLCRVSISSEVQCDEKRRWHGNGPGEAILMKEWSKHCYKMSENIISCCMCTGIHIYLLLKPLIYRKSFKVHRNWKTKGPRWPYRRGRMAKARGALLHAATSRDYESPVYLRALKIWNIRRKIQEKNTSLLLVPPATGLFLQILNCSWMHKFLPGDTVPCFKKLEIPL